MAATISSYWFGSAFVARSAFETVCVGASSLINPVTGATIAGLGLAITAVCELADRMLANRI